ncbi:MAG TPA: hypothetical protein VJZ71_12165 [Phycisphaerae bacterium]|nr:hypothetical protein [Phycisphaerae bacterium]
MPRHVQPYITFSMLASVLLTSACSQKMPAPFWKKDREPHAQSDAPFDPPNTYHEWAYDAPEYAKPAQEPTPEADVEPGDPLHFFTREKVVMIRRPDGYTPEETPRVAVWWTDNNGFHWNKAGYFGREQSFFPFEVDGDGDYGIRFVGPGQEPSLHTAPLPERVYHVDTSPPAVEVTIEPEQSWYHVGDVVTISWKAADYHLSEYPVRIGVLTDFTGDEQNPVELQRDLAENGSITHPLSANALDHEIRFRVDAVDRAGNLGLDISFPLQVVAKTAEEELGGVAATDPSITDASERVSASSVAQPDPPPTLSLVDTDPGESSRPRANGGPARIDTTIPFATAIARTAELEPVEVDPPPPAEPDPSSDSLDPPTGNFSLPDSLTSLPGSSAQPDAGATIQTDRVDDPATVHEPMRESVASVDAAPPIEPPAPSPAPPAPLDFPSITFTAPSSTSELLVPMPATVEKPDEVIQLASAHPWRSLSVSWPAAVQTVWNLPRPNFTPELRRLFDIGTLADGSWARPVAEPPATTRTFVGLPEDAPGAITP